MSKDQIYFNENKISNLVYNLFTVGPVRAAYTLELVDLTGGQNGFTEVLF